MNVRENALRGKSIKKVLKIICLWHWQKKMTTQNKVQIHICREVSKVCKQNLPISKFRGGEILEEYRYGMVDVLIWCIPKQPDVIRTTQ